MQAARRVPKPSREAGGVAPPSLLRRTLLPVLGGLAFMALVAGILWLVAAKLSSDSQRLQVHLGDDVFDIGPARNRANSIREDGVPLFFPDPSPGGSRDIWVTHTSADDDLGWFAFAARAEGTDRACDARIEAGGTTFTNPCTKAVYPLSGTGLTQYKVSIAGGHLFVDLRTVVTPGAGATTTTATIGTTAKGAVTTS
jgi:hypothetical protein